MNISDTFNEFKQVLALNFSIKKISLIGEKKIHGH